ncbi:MAG: aspartate kinase [Candidatus Kapabacteria bacterium]|nr:aspartate kinase [Candidatus Kapabacteria bacterium]
MGAILPAMTVQKFGGAILRNPEGFRAMVSIVGRHAGHGCVVVVSAIGTTTRTLASAAKNASEGAFHSAKEMLHGVAEAHLQLTDAVIRDEQLRRTLRHTLTEMRNAADNLLKSISVTRTCSARTLDRVLAVGEDLARSIASAALSEAGLAAREVDARTLIVTDSAHGNASPLLEPTCHRVKHALGTSPAGIVVTQGFVACSEQGDTTTMGRESSNLSAALLAACIEASNVTIWTDVEGIRTADPLTCAGTFPIEHLQYDQARIAAAYGLKLLYPTMIEPAEKSGIPMHIASPWNADAPGTTIDGLTGSVRPMITTTEHNGRTQVTMLFAPMPLALRAATAVIEAMESSLGTTEIDLATHAHDQAVTIVLPTHAAPEAVRILHREICENPQ